MTESVSQDPSAQRLVAGHRVAHVDDMQAARIEMRNAIQWLARVTHSYCGAPNDKVQLHFDEDARRLSTPDLARDTCLSLHLPELVFQFHDQGVATPHALDVDGRSSTEIEAWLLAELLHRGFDRRLFQKRLPYAWGDEMSGDETKYGSQRLRDQLDRLTQEIVVAALDLKKARQIAIDNASVTPSSDLLFWPERCAVGFTLSCDDENVEITYDMENGGAGHFRFAKCHAGPDADIQISKAPDAGSVAQDMMREMLSLERK